jgi:hypothetical protein
MSKRVSKTAIRHAKVARKREFPAHLQTTVAEWRRVKRSEWREVRQALDRYLYGSAYTPAGAALYHLGKLAAQITEAIDTDDWIAW